MMGYSLLCRWHNAWTNRNLCCELLCEMSRLCTTLLPNLHLYRHICSATGHEGNWSICPLLCMNHRKRLSLPDGLNSNPKNGKTCPSHGVDRWNRQNPQLPLILPVYCLCSPDASLLCLKLCRCRMKSHPVGCLKTARLWDYLRNLWATHHLICLHASNGYRKNPNGE